MFGIIDYIESLERNSNIQVNTICRGKAMSAAAMILACGTGKRLASKRSTVMIHEGSSMQAGKTSDVKAAQKYNAHLENMANTILGEKTTKDKKFWSEQTKTDLYLSEFCNFCTDQKLRSRALDRRKNRKIPESISCFGNSNILLDFYKNPSDFFDFWIELKTLKSELN